MRYMNFDDLSDKEVQLANIWFELIDDVDNYETTRIELVDSIDNIIESLSENDFGGFKQSHSSILDLVEDVPTESLDEIIEDLKKELPELSDIEDDREQLQGKFKECVEFDSSPVFDGLEDWWIEETTMNELKGRIYSQAAIQADARLFKDLKSNGLIDNLNTARANLSSEDTAEEYSSSLIRVIEQFLEKEEEVDEGRLKKSIEELFAELQTRGWHQDDLEKVLKQYIKESERALEDKREDFIDRISERSDSKKCYVGLPEADLSNLTPLSAGHVTFHSVSDSDFDLQSRKHPAASGLKFSEQADVWASAEVAGATANIKVRRLKEKVARAVDVLNLGKKAGTLKFPFDSSYTCLQETSDGKVHPLKGQNDLSELPYSEFASKDDLEDRIDFFEDYLTGKSETSLDESIANAIRWYRYASRSPEKEEEFLKYIIAVESLLVKGKTETKKDTIGQRAVDILQFHEDVRRSQSQLFHEMYDIRSEIVHSGERGIPRLEQQLDTLEHLTVQLITSVQQRVGECDSIEEVTEKIHEEEEDLKESKIERSPFDPGDNFSFGATLATEGGTELASLELDGTFADDGRYVYYQADIRDGQYESGVTLDAHANYEVRFEHDNQSYTGYDVTFPDSDLLTSFPNDDLPETIRWYQLESDQD